MRSVFLLFFSSLAIAGEFTTSLGTTYPYTISAITTDSAGNTYVVGSRLLGGVPTTVLIGDFGALPPVIVSPAFVYAPSDVFVSKLGPTGNLLFTDTFGGKGVDNGTAIAVDPSGNIYIAGTTTSPDFPLSKALQNQPNPTDGTGFIVKLSNDGSTILYSTYFGGALGSTSISSMATDSNGNLYLTGSTNAEDFLLTTGVPLSPVGFGFSGAFLVSVSAAGDRILDSDVLVGASIPVSGDYVINTGGVGVAVDAANNAYFAGNIAIALNLPITPGVLQPAGNFTGFLVKINAKGISYGTYLPTLASHLTVDATGNAYIAGFKGQGPNGPLLVSVAKINPSASAIVWTNNLSGAAEGVQSISVDPNGNVWATGTTSSSTFPNANGWTTGPEFLVGLNSTGTNLTYSALYPSGTVAQSVAVDPTGLVHVAGENGFVSAISPTTAPTMKIFGFQNAFGGSLAARISPAEVISIFGPGIGPATPVTASPTSGFFPTTLAGVQVALNGVDIPLLYVSANQINAVVPMSLTPGTATIHISNGTNVSPDYPVWIAASEPQAFPTVLNQDGTVNSQTNPAKSNSIVTFYATGWQSSFSPLTDGQVATTAQNVCQIPPPPPSAVSAKEPAQPECPVTPPPGVYEPPGTVLYGGAAPGSVAGVTQFNVQIGSVAMSNFAFQFNFSITGPASVAQTVWVAY